MYLSAHLSIDPSQLTKIESVVPTKTYKKLLFVLTGGAGSKKVEKETFNALGILQQFQSVFEEMKIDNMVRLSQDEIDLYVDREGEEGDLIDAINKYDLGQHETMSEQFQTLHLVLEHYDEVFKYWIKIKICKAHEVGEYPIIIEINALFKEFENLSREEIETSLRSTFSSQRSYNSFVLAKRNKFNEFVEGISNNVKRFIKIDDLIITQNKKVLIPRKIIENPQEIRIQNYASDPVFHSYYGNDSSFFYVFFWLLIAKEKGLSFQDVMLYSEEGDVVADLKGETVNCADFELFREIEEYDKVMREANFNYRKTHAERILQPHEGSNQGWFDFGEKPSEDDWV